MVGVKKAKNITQNELKNTKTKKEKQILPLVSDFIEAHSEGSQISKTELFTKIGNC